MQHAIMYQHSHRIHAPVLYVSLLRCLQQECEYHYHTLICEIDKLISGWGVKCYFRLDIFRSQENGYHFADDICKCIFVSEISIKISLKLWGGWGCEVSCGGHHRQRGKTTTGSALDGAVLDFTQILAYLVHNMNRSQLYLGFDHFGRLLSFFGQ